MVQPNQETPLSHESKCKTTLSNCLGRMPRRSPVESYSWCAANAETKLWPPWHKRFLGANRRPLQGRLVRQAAVLEFRLFRASRLILFLTRGGSVSHAHSWENREALPACDTYLPAEEALLASIRRSAWPGRFLSGRSLPPAQCEPDPTNECAKQHAVSLENGDLTVVVRLESGRHARRRVIQLMAIEVVDH